MLYRILKHIENWVEVYFWVPFTFATIYILAVAAYWLSGRKPIMNLDWFPELGVNLFKITCAIAFTSVLKQALWGWISISDKLSNKFYALARMPFELAVFLSIMYYLFNR